MGFRLLACPPSVHVLPIRCCGTSLLHDCSVEYERQLKYAKWRTYQSSHLLENIKHEFLDAEGRVDDHYFLEKVRGGWLVEYDRTA